MTIKEVKVGQKYQMKVSGNLVTVEVLSERTGINGRTGYVAKNLNTGRTLTLRSAGRLRPLPAAVHYFVDCNGASKEITRSEAVQTVNECVGVGRWLESLRQIRSSDGLLIPGIGRLRAVSE